MALFIRNKSMWVNFLHSVQEFREFQDNYLGGPVCIGDVSTFNNSMKNMLLKFIEENPNVSCFSSSDVVDRVLMSRFVKVVKEPYQYSRTHSPENYLDSDKSYLSTDSLLSGISPSAKLIVPKLPRQFLNLYVR